MTAPPRPPRLTLWALFFPLLDDAARSPRRSQEEDVRRREEEADDGEKEGILSFSPTKGEEGGGERGRRPLSSTSRAGLSPKSATAAASPRRRGKGPRRLQEETRGNAEEGMMTEREEKESFFPSDSR